MTIRLPDETQHIAIAGRTGSGKTVAALEMLSKRDMEKHAQIIVDHKRDDNIKLLPAEPLNINALILPQRGLYVVRAEPTEKGAEELEGFLSRVFNKGRIGLYIDEGHLMPHRSEAVRRIMVAGRSKHVTMMWTSQRAHWIDPFIWSQSSFYRVFQLQGPADQKRFNEFFPRKYFQPEEYHSHYYDVSKGTQHYLAPSGPMEQTINRFYSTLKTNLKAI